MSAAAPSLATPDVETVTPRTRAEINRANAQHSTGPRTPEGKARASQNALKHGLFADSIVLPGEDRDAFNSLARTYAQDHNAETEEELGLVQDIVSARWRILRICARETALTVLTTEQQRPAVEKMFEAQTFDDPEAALTALAQAAGFQANARLFNQLSLAETRLNRRADLAEKKLLSLVKTRCMRSLPEHGLDFLDINHAQDVHDKAESPEQAAAADPGFVPPLSSEQPFPSNMPHFNGPLKKENRRQWLRKHGFQDLAKAA